VEGMVQVGDPRVVAVDGQQLLGEIV